jgi:hypothetical protein
MAKKDEKKVFKLFQNYFRVNMLGLELGLGLGWDLGLL